MGSGNSKPESPKAAVNITITQEVAERWASLARERLQQQETKKSNDGEKDVVNNLVPKVTSLPPIETIELDHGKDKLTASSELESSVLSSSDLPLSSSKSEEKPELAGLAPAPTATNTDPTEEQIVYNYDNMGKFGNFFVPSDSTKLRHDLENGNDIMDHLKNYETRYSAFLRKPSDSYKNPPLYEEIDETTVEKRKHFDFVDQEALIGQRYVTSRQLSRSAPPLKEIRVPKPALPVVLDEDEEGKLTVEAISSWKLKERFEKEMSKNNSYWCGELQRITAKIENETRIQADELQMRIENLKKLHAESIDPPFKTNHHCNRLASQIGQCYQQNGNQVLKCNDLVRQFAKCTNETV